jgi:hypothetical protein
MKRRDFLIHGAGAFAPLPQCNKGREAGLPNNHWCESLGQKSMLVEINHDLAYYTAMGSGQQSGGMEIRPR